MMANLCELMDWHNKTCGNSINFKLKGTYYAKIIFIRCLNSFVATVCENKTSLLKNPPNNFLIKQINHEQPP